MTKSTNYTLVISFDLRADGKSILSGYPARNTYSVEMGEIKPDSIFLGDISSRAAQFLQYLHLQYAQNDLRAQQIQDLDESGKRRTIEIAFPLKWAPLQNYSCEIKEKENSREHPVQEPTLSRPPGHHSLYGQAGEVIDYSVD